MSTVALKSVLQKHLYYLNVSTFSTLCVLEFHQHTVSYSYKMEVKRYIFFFLPLKNVKVCVCQPEAVVCRTVSCNENIYRFAHLETQMVAL